MGARARPRIARDGAQVALRLDARITGRLQRRYRRFFADVALASGEVVTAHWRIALDGAIPVQL